MKWTQIQAVCAASSRFSGGKGWGLNGNDVVEDLGSTGIPVYNMSAGCAAGGNAFNVGYSMVAGGVHDMGAGGRRRSDAQGHDPDLGVEESRTRNSCASAASACPDPRSGQPWRADACTNSAPPKNSSRK
ncbi:MAG: hypothetical protein IPH83_13780 [Gammaproteobacteria bacterium]|nr:hypothetical protein [Gammaproteobacteria bacterium]